MNMTETQVFAELKAALANATCAYCAHASAILEIAAHGGQLKGWAKSELEPFVKTANALEVANKNLKAAVENYQQATLATK